MSLLMFLVDPNDGALIVTDTLVTDPWGNPNQFTTKCRLLPHLNMAMAGTGSGNLLNAWAHTLVDEMLAVDIDMVAAHAQRRLADLWDQILSAHEDELKAESARAATATIYHFGQDRSGSFVWYAFRSTSGFEPERRSEGGFGVKPEPSSGLDPETGIPDSLDEMIALAVAIRTEQDQSPRPERVSIGGELWLTSIRDDVMAQGRLLRFDDWSNQWEEINAAHRSEG